MVSRGDVRWTETPEDGRRPVLVLTRDEAIPVMQQITVASITRTIRGIPTEVRLDTADGMPEECVVSLDNIRRVRRVYLGEPITRLTGHRMHEVCCALTAAVSCA